jgi:hypothetical protein
VIGCPAGRASYAEGGHFVTCDCFAWSSRCSEMAPTNGRPCVDDLIVPAEAVDEAAVAFVGAL